MSNDPNVGGFGQPGQYYEGYKPEDIKRMQSDIANFAPGIGGFHNPLMIQHRQQALSLLAQIHADKNLDEESRKYLLQNFTSGPTGTRVKDTQGKIDTITNEYRSALEGTDPKFKARVATQKYYETMFDQPGSRQTRGADFSLLMSNATKR
jgi:hypothetical protein